VQTKAVRTDFPLAAGLDKIIAIQSCQAEDTAVTSMIYMSLLINSETCYFRNQGKQSHVLD